MSRSLPRGRRFVAGCFVLLAAALLAAVPAPASAADGLYTQVLCADPQTGRGVAQDGVMPDRVTTDLPEPSQGASIAETRCASGREITGSDGMLLTVGTGYEVSTPFWGPWLRYQAPSDIGFEGARIYRAGALGNSWGWAIIAADTTDYVATTRFDVCWQNFDCHGRGASSTPFRDSGDFETTNVREIPAHPSGGFTLKFGCHIVSGLCAANKSAVRIFGGRVKLRDDTPPAVAGDLTGELATASTLRGVAEIGVAATSQGSGVYRVIVRVDGTDRSAQVASANGGRCRDVNPANDDPYEFAFARPCSASTSGVYAFDTTALGEGRHRVVVQVESASGKRATVVNRDVLIDNFPPPVAVTPPLIAGLPRRGNLLLASDAVFDDHGAPGDVTITRVWQRCGAGGVACTDIPGATGTTYTPRDADLNRVLRVVVTGRNAEGAAESASALTERVTREDGTLPPDNDGVDNDGDGVIDEPGETAPGGGGAQVSTATVAGRDGRDGLNGANGAESRSAAVAGALNGDGASPRARLTAMFATGSARGRVAYGKTIRVTGRLVDESGRPIRNAIVDVLAVRGMTGAKPAGEPAVVTDADGAFRYTATSKAGTRTITFAYRYLRSGPVIAAANLTLTVRSAVSLKVALRGIVVRYSGRVSAGSMPRGGKLVVVQGRAKGSSWQTFATRRTTRGGAFKGRYRLKVRRPGKLLQFRVRVLTESGWNFASATSKTVSRRVR